MAERGCLVIADISGYTDYVVQSPLEHAEDVLAEITELVADRLGAAFRVNKREGDALFAYAIGERIDASMLLDAVDAAYFAFRARLEGIGHSTSCGCAACAKLPDLDLKLVLHYGSFIRRPSATGEELTGRDVIVVHRLLKNAVAEAFGTRGYVLATADCVEALGIDAAVLGFREHRETYGDVGEMRVFVLDLEQRFRDEENRRRVVVTAEEAAFEVETLLPATPSVAWEHLTAPEKRAQWRETTVEESSVGGRRAAGSTSYCVDGRALVYEEILDWRPFTYFTEGRRLRGATRLVLTTELEPAGDSTRVVTRGAVEGRRGFGSRAAIRAIQRSLSGGYERLGAILADGTEPVADPSEGSCGC